MARASPVHPELLGQLEEMPHLPQPSTQRNRMAAASAQAELCINHILKEEKFPLQHHWVTLQLWFCRALPAAGSRVFPSSSSLAYLGEGHKTLPAVGHMVLKSL